MHIRKTDIPQQIAPQSAQPAKKGEGKHRASGAVTSDTSAPAPSEFAVIAESEAPKATQTTENKLSALEKKITTVEHRIATLKKALVKAKVEQTDVAKEKAHGGGGFFSKVENLVKSVFEGITDPIVGLVKEEAEGLAGMAKDLVHGDIKGVAHEVGKGFTAPAETVEEEIDKSLVDPTKQFAEGAVAAAKEGVHGMEHGSIKDRLEAGGEATLQTADVAVDAADSAATGGRVGAIQKRPSMEMALGRIIQLIDAKIAGLNKELKVLKADEKKLQAAIASLKPGDKTKADHDVIGHQGA